MLWLTLSSGTKGKFTLKDICEQIFSDLYQFDFNFFHQGFFKCDCLSPPLECATANFRLYFQLDHRPRAEAYVLLQATAVCLQCRAQKLSTVLGVSDCDTGQ